MKKYVSGTLPHELRCPHTVAEMRPLFCRDCTADEVFERYKIVKNSYFKGKPYLSDENYDRFESYCRNMFPEDDRFYLVGEIP